MSESTINLISVCVTLLLGVAGFIINTFVQRKNNSIEIITKKRLSRRDLLQSLSASILSLSDPDYIDCLADSGISDYCRQLVISCSKLRSLLEFQFPYDADFVTLAYKVKSESIRAVKQKNRDYSKVKESRRKFAELMDLYTTTEWQRIKSETVGKNKSAAKRYQYWLTLMKHNHDSFYKDDSAKKHRDLYS